MKDPRKPENGPPPWQNWNPPTKDLHLWELEWQDYAQDPDTLDTDCPSRLALLLLWATCIIVCLAVWAGIIAAALSIVHWIQRLIP